jgi:hypothetical protein
MSSVDSSGAFLPFFPIGDIILLLDVFPVRLSLCPLYGYLPPQWLLPLLWPSVPSAALCPLFSPMTPVRPSAPSTALCPFYDPAPPIRPPSSRRPSVSSTALWPPPFCGLLSPLWPSVLFTTLCPLYGPLSSLRPSASSSVVFLLYNLMSPLWLSVSHYHSLYLL